MKLSMVGIKPCITHKNYNTGNEENPIPLKPK